MDKNDGAASLVRSDALLAAVLTAWENGVKRWREKHQSYPTAFSELAHVMDDVRDHVHTDNKEVFVER
jgi:hypothetical protein